MMINKDEDEEDAMDLKPQTRTFVRLLVAMSLFEMVISTHAHKKTSRVAALSLSVDTRSQILDFLLIRPVRNESTE
jgi:hypothetical protein